MYLHRPRCVAGLTLDYPDSPNRRRATNHICKFVVGAFAVFLFLSGPVSAADAQESPGVEVDGDTVSVGDDVVAGDGCARAGGVTVGDCQTGSQETTNPLVANDGTDEPALETTSDDQSQSKQSEVPEETAATETTRSETPDKDSTNAESTDQDATTPAGADESDSTADDVCPSAPPDDAVPAVVDRAVDGDTVELKEPVKGYDSVRFIGVDTPELSGAGGPEPKAEKASEFTANALEDQRVLLETDEEIEDPYSHLLAYVWIPQDSGEPELFNRTLIEEDLAEVMTVKPNDAHADCFNAAADPSSPKDSDVEKTQQKPDTDDEGVLGKIQNLLSPDEESKAPPEGTEESSAPDKQYANDTSTKESDIETTQDETTTESTQPSEETTGSSDSPAKPSDTGIDEDSSKPSAPAGDTLEKAAETQYATDQTTTVAEDSTDRNPADLVAVTPEDCPGGTVVLDPYPADGDAVSDSFKVTGGSFVVRSNLKGTGGAPLNFSVLDADTEEPVTAFDQRDPGSYDTRLDVGPGNYRLKSEPPNEASKVSYELAAFDCADDAPPESAKSEKPDTSPAQDSTADPGARLDLDASEPAAPETTGQDTEQYPEVGSPDARWPVEALPVEDSPSGPVAVLPDTGGPAASPILLAGVLALAVGGTGFLSLVTTRRQKLRRPGSDRW